LADLRPKESPQLCCEKLSAKVATVATPCWMKLDVNPSLTKKTKKNLSGPLLVVEAAIRMTQPVCSLFIAVLNFNEYHISRISLTFREKITSAHFPISNQPYYYNT
jgi:hypothetical protein